MYHVIFHSDVRVFHKSLCDKGKENVVPEGLHRYESIRRGVLGGENVQHMLLGKCLVHWVAGGMGQVVFSRSLDGDGLFLGHGLCEQYRGRHSPCPPNQ